MPRVTKDTLWRKLWRRFSVSLIDIAERLPRAKTGLFRWLQEVRHGFTGADNATPEGYSFVLDTVWIAEILPIEEFENSIPSIVNLIIDRADRNWRPNHSESRSDLERKLRDYKNKINSISWTRLATLRFGDNKKNSMIETIQVQLLSFKGGHICLMFGIEPTEEFRQRINTILATNYCAHTELKRPRLRNVFRGWWGSTHKSGEYSKLLAIQREMQLMKWSAVKYLKKYFTGMVLKKGHHLPSTELWVKSKSKHAVAEIPDQQLRAFYNSVGMRRGPFDECKEPEGKLYLYMPDDDANDFAVKILADQDKWTLKEGYTDIRSQLQASIEYWVSDFQLLWCLTAVYEDMNLEMAHTRLHLFSHKRRMRGKLLFNYLTPLFGRETSLLRLERDLNEEGLRAHLKGSGFPPFSYSLPADKCVIVLDTLVSKTTYLRKSALETVKDTKELLRTTLDVESIRVNLRMQRRLYWLSIIMMIMAFLTTITNKDIMDFLKTTTGTILSLLR